MKRERKIYAAKCAVVLSVVPVLIYAHSSGPDPRKTGAPGDSTCNEIGCHVGTALNGGGGNVQIKLAGDATYTPGQKQRIQVVVTDSAGRFFGFQASSRPDGSKSVQAGSFSPIDNTTQVICEDGSNRPATGVCRNGQLEFIEHTFDGESRRSNTYSFDWTAPGTDVGKVTIYVAANAANGNGTETGDHIYTTTVSLTAATSGGNPNAPAITQNGITDGMNFQTGLTPSSWISIFGQNLLTTQRDWTGAPEFSSNKLPMSLDGVSVTINNKPAAVYFISPAQVNVLSPADIGTGPMNVVVTNAAGSATATVTSQPASALYAPFADTNKRLFVTAVALNGDLLGKVGLDSRVKRALQPGESVILFGTGFGDTSPAAPTDSVFSGAFSLKALPTIQIGGIDAKIAFGGIVSPGLYQFNLTVPDNAPDGDLPITCAVGAIKTNGNVMISVKK